MERIQQVLRGWDTTAVGRDTYDAEGYRWTTLRYGSVFSYQYTDYGYGLHLVPLRFWTLERSEYPRETVGSGGGPTLLYRASYRDHPSMDAPTRACLTALNDRLSAEAFPDILHHCRSLDCRADVYTEAGVLQGWAYPDGAYTLSARTVGAGAECCGAPGGTGRVTDGKKRKECEDGTVSVNTSNHPGSRRRPAGGDRH